MKRISVFFYRTEAGGEPVREWLKSLKPVSDRTRIGIDIGRVEFGWPIGMPTCRPLKDGLYEVRSGISDGRIARVIFYIDFEGQMVLLHGFIKKSQKTPDAIWNWLARTNEFMRQAQEESMKKSEQQNIHTGSSFEDFLESEGIRNEVESVAIKQVLAWQFQQAMEEQQKTKRAMAKELKTSRSQLDRLLDPANTAVSLETITRAANVLGKQLVFEIRDKPVSPLKVSKRKASC